MNFSCTRFYGVVDQKTSEYGSHDQCTDLFTALILRLPVTGEARLCSACAALRPKRKSRGLRGQVEEHDTLPRDHFQREVWS